MLKRRGFTMIEVLTTITILAIVATIAAPEYWRWRDRDSFRAAGQNLFDSILSSRTAAQTSRLCSNGNTSYKWQVKLDRSVAPPVFSTECFWDESNFMVEGSVQTLNNSIIERVEYNDGIAPLTGTLRHVATVFSFYSGSASGLLEHERFDGAIQKKENVTLLIGHDDSSYQHTICFNRVAGFPTFNKTGDTCQTY